MRLILLAMLLSCPSAWGQVYKWTDPSGKTVYGDRPPDEAKAKQLRIQSFDQPVEVRDWAKVLRAKSASAYPSSSGVTMFSTVWCGYCKKARAYFASKGIAFAEFDVEKSDEGRRRYEELGGGGVPIILVGNRMLQGFSEGAFESLRK
jgi:glutaredoxin